ncbi:MAG TPA: hypothetical protein VJ571_04205 [Candidatus Nitrosotalea sp.]|nr:hypothetical protein [Candidatus Nitrosotalea sp.]
MTRHLIEQILSGINKMVESYEKLHNFEKHGCTSEQIKKELHSMENSTEELTLLMTRLQKENLGKIQGLSTIESIFKITYLPTLKIHLIYLEQIGESNMSLLKIQSRLAITYLNVDGCIDNLRIIHAYLK